MVPRPRLTRRDLLKHASAGAGALAVGGSLPGLLAASSPPAAISGARATSEVLQLARVWLSKGQQALLDGFDDTHRVFEDGSIELLLWPGDLARLERTGLRFEITVGDLAARDASRDREARGVSRVRRQPGETDGDYRTYDQYVADLKKLAEAYPDKAKLIELPYRSYEGRQIFALEIARDVHRRDGRAVFYQDGIHHAREWPAGEVPIMWAFDLLESDGKDPRVTNLMARARNLVVPIVNPDGFEHSRAMPIGTGTADLGLPVGAPFLGGDGAEAIVLGGRGRYWRKNRRPYSSRSIGPGLIVAPDKPGGNVDAYGVDPNRNYALNWGDDQGGSSSDLHAQNHRGHEPFSEPETRNVSWLLSRYPCVAVVSHHTSGDLVLWPWGDTYDAAPDDGLLQALGRSMATYNGYRPQKGIELYITTGTMSDWTYGAYGSLGYTFEHAGDAFHPPYPETVPAMYEKNRDALLLLAEQACLRPQERPKVELPKVFTRYADPGTLNVAIVTGRLIDRRRTPVAGTVRIVKRFDTKLWKFGDGSNPTGMASIEEHVDMLFETDAKGRFELRLNPSTRPQLEFAGETERYELIARAGNRGTAREVVVKRGQQFDLGTLIVS